MREKILAVIEKNSRIDIKDLAVLLGESEIAVANEIAEMEKEHIICGYHTLINWDNTSEEKVVRGWYCDAGQGIFHGPPAGTLFQVSGSTWRPGRHAGGRTGENPGLSGAPNRAGFTADD